MENVNKRRLVIRIALVVLLVLLCFGLYYIGKEHDVYVDNKTVTIDGREYQEIEYLALVVNGDEKDSVEYFAGDRDVLKLQGPNHTLKIIVMDEDTEEVIKTVERKLSLGTIPAIMVSMPAIAEEAENIELPLPHLQQAWTQGRPSRNNGRNEKSWAARSICARSYFYGRNA